VRDADGHVRDVERYAETSAKARRVLETALRARTHVAAEAGGITPATTVERAAVLWLNDLTKRGAVSTNTLAAYTATLERYVIGRAGTRGPLEALTMREVTVAALDHAVHTIASENGYGAAKMARTVYNGIFGMAVRHGAMQANPVRDVSPLRRPRATPNGRRDTTKALTRIERDDLLRFVRESDHAQRFDLADLVAFLAGTGVRIGEALALRWEDMDTKQGTAHIGATLVRTAGHGNRRQDATKTKAGDRTVLMPGWLADLLTERRKSLMATGRLAGLTEPVVFPSPLGHLRDARNTQRQLRRVFDDAGLPWATAHTLRKTVATLLDEADLSAREIADQLGHARPSLTQDVYMARGRISARVAEVL
jgi:integrase